MAINTQPISRANLSTPGVLSGMDYSRFLLALAFGLPAGAFALLRGDAGDLGGSLCLGRALLAGLEPYTSCPMQVAHDALPAALLLLPLLAFPPVWAGVAWNVLTTALLAWLLLDGPRWRLLVFASVGYALTVFYSQWGALLLAVAIKPDLLPLALAKPHTGIVLGLWRFSWRRAALSAAVLAATLLLDPDWPIVFVRQATRYTTVDTGMIPILRYPWLALLLVAWRDDRARLILLTACVPQRAFYNLLPLLLVPQSARTMAGAVAMGWIGVAVAALGGQDAGLLLGAYLPAVAAILVDRITPNSPAA